MLPLEGDRKPVPLLHTGFNERRATLSPDMPLALGPFKIFRPGSRTPATPWAPAQRPSLWPSRPIPAPHAVP
jgi:hypothetical protein